MISVWTLRWSIGWALMYWACIGWVIPLIMMESGNWWSLLISLLITVGIIVGSRFWAPLYFDRYRFEIRHDEVVVTKGVLFTRRTSIPFARIQNINVLQGPIMRRYGLQNISLETAGSPLATGSYAGGFTMQGEGHLAGLPEGYAERVADELMDMVKEYKAREGL